MRDKMLMEPLLTVYSGGEGQVGHCERMEEKESHVCLTDRRSPRNWKCRP